MPNVNTLLTPGELYPTGTGAPRTVVGTPSVPQPSLTPAAGQAVGEGLAHLGAGIENFAAGVQRAQLYQAALQKAQNTLDSHSALNSYTTNVDRYVADQQLEVSKEKVKYQDLPDLVQKYHEDLVGQLGESMNPQARQLFQIEAGKRFAVVNRDVLKYRDDQMAFHGNELKVEARAVFVDGVLHATSPADADQRMLQYQTTLDRLADARVLRHEEVPGEVFKARQTIAEQQMELRVQKDPQGALTDLLTGGTQLDPALNPLLIPKLIASARGVIRQQDDDRTRHEVVADKAMGKRQDLTEVAFQTRLNQISPLPENLAQYDQLLAETNGSAQILDLSREGFQRITHETRTLRGVALNPPQIQDAAMERRLAILIKSADNDADFTAVRRAVIDGSSRILPETLRTFLGDIEARKNQTHPLHLPGVQMGRRAIISGDISESGQMAMQRGALSEAEQVRLRTALDIYDARVMELTQTSREQANAQAPAIGTEIRRTYMELPAKADILRRLPLPLQGNVDATGNGAGIEDETTAVAIIRRLPNTPDTEKERIYTQWYRWRYVIPQGYTPPQQRLPIGSQGRPHP